MKCSENTKASMNTPEKSTCCQCNILYQIFVKKNLSKKVIKSDQKGQMSFHRK